MDGFDLHRARCLSLLQTRGLQGATTDELSDPQIGGHEGPRRVRELRALGHPVQRERLISGYWRYWLDASTSTAQGAFTWDDDREDTDETNPVT